MRDTTRSISDKSLSQLSTRAQRLATTVESATKISSDATVRREGARLGEVLEEWLEDIKGLLERQDATAADRLESFETRLRMAESKVDRWNVPASVIAQSTPRKKSAKQQAAAEKESELEVEERPWYADDLEEIPVSGEGGSANSGKKSRAA